MTEASEYIVYADESGDHDLTRINKNFPVFCLSFCAMKKGEYVREIVPEFQAFKFDFWGHDAIVLHEHEIRKNTGPFAILRKDPNLRAAFYERLNGLIFDAPVSVFASVIKKNEHVKKYAYPMNPYSIALLFCMERLLEFLLKHGESGKRIHILFESRGKREDNELEIEFRRICDNRASLGSVAMDFTQMQLEPVFIPKSANSTGLQLADLTARPIALQCIKPEQDNRAYDIIAQKIGYGALKWFP